MGDSRRWLCSYREMSDTSAQGAAQRVVDAVSKDPNAIGITTFDAVSAETRVVAIQSSQQGGSLPTTETLASGRYILGRSVFAVARGQNDGHVEANIHNFLSYLMSNRAQAIIAADGSYVPLAELALEIERKKLR
jgi:ABC-type phosphate transport system substrate-binding protein